MTAARRISLSGTAIAALTLLACSGPQPATGGADAAGPAPATASQAGALYFPPAGGAWETVAPAAAGWDPARLEAALALAADRASTGVVILHRGRIMAERHWTLDDASPAHTSGSHPRTANGHAVEDVASVQKSVVAVLVGMARARGLLHLDDPVAAYEPGWSAASPEQESDVTIRHLLAMTTGLTPELAFEAAPGTTWRYNTPAYHHLLRIVAGAAGREPNAVTRDWLTGPLGMADSRWEPRPWARTAIGTGFVTTARDLARFGLLVLAGGAWEDETIVDADHLAELLGPSQALNPAYGLLWWVNGQASALSWALPPEETAGPLIPSAPPDLVAAQGARDRKLYVVPSLDLVVARLGDNGSTDASSFNDAFWWLLAQAAPRSAQTPGPPPGRSGERL